MDNVVSHDAFMMRRLAGNGPLETLENVIDAVDRGYATEQVGMSIFHEGVCLYAGTDIERCCLTSAAVDLQWRRRDDCIIAPLTRTCNYTDGMAIWVSHLAKLLAWSTEYCVVFDKAWTQFNDPYENCRYIAIAFRSNGKTLYLFAFIYNQRHMLDEEYTPAQMFAIVSKHNFDGKLEAGLELDDDEKEISKVVTFIINDTLGIAQ